MASTQPDTEKMTETSYQMGTAEGVSYAAGMQKQGHKCCGGCCDVRRAVIIVNIVQAVLVFMAMMSVLTMHKMSAQAQDLYDDDEVAKMMSDFGSLPVGALIAILVVKAIGAVIGIIGGIKFNMYMTGIAGAIYAISCVVSIVFLDLPGAIYAGFFAYPHYFLVKEIRSGIMSEENYPNEKQSCCCV